MTKCSKGICIKNKKKLFFCPECEKHLLNIIFKILDKNDNELDIFYEILNELETATSKFGAFNSAHEGYAILLEEVDELWENVKLNQKTPNRIKLIKEESIQVAAMAIRMIIDCCEGK